MTTCATNDGYKGMSHTEIDKAISTIPPVPENFSASNAPAEMKDTDCEPTYAQVNFHGNYGLLCGQYQEFTRYNITESQISEIGWAAFGMCGWKADRC